LGVPHPFDLGSAVLRVCDIRNEIKTLRIPVNTKESREPHPWAAKGCGTPQLRSNPIQVEGVPPALAWFVDILSVDLSGTPCWMDRFVVV